MDNAEKQISLIYNTESGDSSKDIISFMISRVLRNRFSEDMGDGAVYFATDAEEAPDFGSGPLIDIILFENISQEDIPRALQLAQRTSKGARILAPPGYAFLEEAKLSLTVTIITYSATDTAANICPNKITPLADGGFELEAVYQSNPTGRGSLKDRIFPTYNKNMFGKMKVNSMDRKDIAHALKAFGFGLALSIEPKYLTGAISEYVFDSMRNLPKKEEPKQAPSRAACREEKEFDED